MSSSVKRLEETGSALRVALATQDWAAIGELDLQCRQAVDEAMVDSAGDEDTLRARMQELLDLYRELVLVCQREQQRLSHELVQLNQSQHGARVYQLFG
ncbi:flagellar protein FliT [Pseudomonas sp. HMWF032]|uniref:flagellar protein FliT n=1 Tax=unclassified Pseudomonas TaxID=196821 RepID=UPI000D358317|nr:MULTISPECIES: flagellar protein FliT [unclassified Pseudomonas]PTS83624.1 flagellar protein FliT [Pseudomonas sp. HMWF032]PTT84016.1 flagellar protein FliT [Pseudomonas sp. HMWF010]WAC44860.1 flagellar protein FliT [Pseudomonas sp. SL4(2022)]